MEREERSERFAAMGVAEARREANRDNIVFLLFLDTEQKVVPNLVSYKFFLYFSNPSFFILYCP